MGIVILIQDITEIRKLEKMRSGFVANVSHELRTPLTSISGFIETLKSGTIDDEKTKRRFLDIIDIETDRLTRLIDDILTLSDIENTTHKDIRQEILTSDLIKEVEEMMKPVAIAKGVNIISEIESNLTDVHVELIEHQEKTQKFKEYVQGLFIDIYSQEEFNRRVDAIFHEVFKRDNNGK